MSGPARAGRSTANSGRYDRPEAMDRLGRQLATLIVHTQQLLRCGKGERALIALKHACGIIYLMEPDRAFFGKAACSTEMHLREMVQVRIIVSETETKHKFR